MKVLVGTDFHGNEAAFESFASKAEEGHAEILVICGDITHFGTLDQAKYLLSMLSALRVPLLFVPGNCDPPSLVGVDIEGANCIHGKAVSYDDLTFLGVGGSPPTPFSTPFEMTEEEKFLADLDLKDQIVFDVGAFNGLLTMFFARAVGKNGKVVAFEPNPSLCNKIKENLMLNNFDNVKVNQLALGRERKKETLAFPSANALAKAFTLLNLEFFLT